MGNWFDAAFSEQHAAPNPAGAAQTGSDDSAFVQASKIGWQDKLNSIDHKRLKAFLKEHPGIRTRKPKKQRLEIHAGDWARYWAEKEAGELKPVDEKIANELALDPRIAKRADNVKRRAK